MKQKFWEIYRKINKLPKWVRIEACSTCQLNCRDCYMRKNHINKTAIKAGYLKFNDFKKFLDTNPYVTDIELSFSGEMFLNPELKDILEYAYTKNIKLTAFNSCNFNTVSDDVLEALVKYKFLGLNISLDGTSNETYIKYRRNGNYEQVIENIKRLNYYKEKYNSVYPAIIWQFIIFEHNINEVLQARQLAKELKCERVMYVKRWIEEGECHNKKENMLWFKGNNLPPISKNEQLLNQVNNKINFYPCLQLWTDPQFNFDGTLMGCVRCTHVACGDNVFDSNLNHIYKTSKNLKKMKKAVLGINDPTKEISCYYCSFYKEMKKNNKFLSKEIIKKYTKNKLSYDYML